MIRVAVVGLRFGAEFVPIYQQHPDVGGVAVCDTNPEALERTAAQNGIVRRFVSLDDVLASPEIDAIHLASPVRFHARQTIAALEAGKHCACAVPMATTVADIRAIIDAQARSGRNYMMMETAVYTREFLYARDLLQRGELGTLTFLRGAHLQNIEGLPDYWKGYPPMHYITHALSPLLALAETRAASVSCLGSGTLPPHLRAVPGYDQPASESNPFPTQTAQFRLAGSDLAAEVTMSFFQFARPYIENFCVYGDRAGLEWQMQNEPPLLFRMEEPTAGRRGRSVQTERSEPPFRTDLLPPQIADFTIRGAHGGSHPHLVHEFVRSIVEGRAPRVDAATAANWTAPGLFAHESSLRDGEKLVIPDFAAR